MKVIIINDFSRPWRGGNLNVRQLLNPIFFTRDVRHPDRKRQRITRQRDLMLWGARKVKAEAATDMGTARDKGELRRV
jgi:hypothetical protein